MATQGVSLYEIKAGQTTYFSLLKGYAEVGSDTEEGMHKCMGTNALID